MKENQRMVQAGDAGYDSSISVPPDEPRPGMEPFRPLHPRVVSLWRVSLVLQAIGATAVAFGLERFGPAWIPGGWLPGLVIGIGVTLALVLPLIRYRAWGFRVGAHTLVVRGGVLTRTTSVVPHARIQHADTRQNLLERWLGLARVVVFTAGIRGAETAIPGLTTEEAESLRDRLAVMGARGDAT